MAFDLSKLRNNIQPNDDNKKTSKLDTSKLKVQNPEKETKASGASFNGLNLANMNKPQPEPVNPGFSLSFTEGKTYNLDEIIAEKNRDNSNSTLILRTTDDPLIKAQMIEKVTKKILNDYNIPYAGGDDYKNQVSKVPNFPRIFDAYYNKYYRIYVGTDTVSYTVTNETTFENIIGKQYYDVRSDGSVDTIVKVVTENDYNLLLNKEIALRNEKYDGSISLDSIFRDIPITAADMKKYGIDQWMGMVEKADNSGRFLSYTDRYRPMVIWTDGTPDNYNPSINELYDKTNIDSDNISVYIKNVLKNSENITVIKDGDYVILDVNAENLSKSEYFHQLAEIAEINEKLINIQDQMNELSNIVGEADIEKCIKVSYSKDVYGALESEMEDHYLNIELPFDISADDLIYVGKTVHEVEASEGTLKVMFENPRDYKVYTLANGSLNFEATKHMLDDIEELLSNETYNLNLVADLDTGSLDDSPELS